MISNRRFVIGSMDWWFKNATRILQCILILIECVIRVDSLLLLNFTVTFLITGGIRYTACVYMWGGGHAKSQNQTSILHDHMVLSCYFWTYRYFSTVHYFSRLHVSINSILVFALSMLDGTSRKTAFWLTYSVRPHSP